MRYGRIGEFLCVRGYRFGSWDECMRLNPFFAYDDKYVYD